MKTLSLEGVTYKILTERHRDETCKLLIDIFINDEYLTRESGLTYDEFAVLANEYCDHTVADGLSVIAIDSATKKVIGFAITEDPYLKNAIDPNKYLKVSPNYKHFNDILEQMHERFMSEQEKNPHECFHLFLLGVNKLYRGKKIGTHLMDYAEQLARELNFAYILVEATSPGTKPICIDLKYETLGNIPYEHYELAGEKPFAHIMDYDGPYLYRKALEVEKVLD